ncbi:TRI27 protein, partial [Tachuris rubrigastra]|nr:TRI27 protein [Tachuris rubrigastra]
MSLPGTAELLRAEVSCPICLGLFLDPVSIPCGHTFCRGCITRCREGPGGSGGGSLPCPRCRSLTPERNLRPNRELGNVAEIVRGLRPAGPAPGTLCQRHREPLRLFCRDHRAPLCLVCGRSREHRLHVLLPAEEAAQEFKVRTRPAPGKALPGGGNVPIPLPALPDKASSEGQRMAREFAELRRFLREQERLLLAQLGDLDREIRRAQDRALAKVSEELSHLDTLIWEMEGKFQLPPSQFLQVSKRGGLGLYLFFFWPFCSCESMKFNPPAEISPELERRLEDFAQRNVLVRGILRRCQAAPNVSPRPRPAAEVTLDPSTAHPNLHVSEDGKQARGHLVPRDVPDGPQRFDFEPCVLARGGFTSGRHFWDVEVGRGGVWALGVVRESAPRKGPLSLSPRHGVWALGSFHSLTSPRADLRRTPLPRRLRVALDYEGGRVGFFGPEDAAPILEHTRAAFRGEKVLPWFRLGLGARLRDVELRDPPRGERGASPLDWVGFGVPLRICR